MLSLTMDGSVPEKEWLTNRGPELPAELPGKVLAQSGPIKQAVESCL